MKNFYCERRVDKLGRIVLPKQVRTTLSLIEGSRLNLALDGEKIILTKVTEIRKIKLLKDFIEIMYSEFNKSALIIFDDEIVCGRGKLEKFINSRKLNKNALKLLKNNDFIEKIELFEGFLCDFTCFKLCSLDGECGLFLVLDRLNNDERLLCEMLIKMFNLED